MPIIGNNQEILDANSAPASKINSWFNAEHHPVLYHPVRPRPDSGELVDGNPNPVA